MIRVEHAASFEHGKMEDMDNMDNFDDMDDMEDMEADNERHALVQQLTGEKTK
jgi:hypothetical protein